MHLTIVPLAGPDFYTQRFGIRPLFPTGGSTLLERVLDSRPWLAERSPGEGQLVFILREEGEHTAVMRKFIAQRYPHAQSVTLSRQTGGAPLSALSGIALAQSFDIPVIVDLADIIFEMQEDPLSYFRTHENVDAIVPYFSAQDPKFSYLRLDGPRVLEAREKVVISSHASAGVYFFRDVPTYLRAVSYCVQHPEMCKVGSALFVCPSVNALIDGERQVHGLEVGSVEPLSAIFH